ncbi:hypothetical protein GV791_30310 [Nocardia cyriacigeorgica]|uniref:Uncharacterized protein n=1 Tax=Nocardia cyriacigeorgica TaxID=135487 RepID=A0A6P1CW60_9NOCA|nr:hypothetical protein [Nocardia cyriacigeorgica]MBF6423480.1 hypothetical protein [Nocardia cyriacigeorgica]NEW36818.1 hypothetical protein [Nocardia cyriacigeorgica]
MSDDTQAQLQQWQELKQQAIDGTLRMEEGIGEALRSACDSYIDKLENLKADAQQLQHLSGYGGLPSALHLRNKFQDKAVNGRSDDPDDSAVKRLEKHIEIAQLMHDTYAAAIGQLKNTDQAVGQNVTSTGEGIR